jgi:hypothetical protein
MVVNSFNALRKTKKACVGVYSIHLDFIIMVVRGNEPSGSIKRWEVLEWLHNWQLLKKGSAPRVGG